MLSADQIIEQLAFGRESKESLPRLGLYLSPDVVYLSETQMKGGKLIVDHLVKIPIRTETNKSNATVTMNTDFLTDPGKIADVIKQSMAQMSWNTKRVRVTLSHHLGLLRYFIVPSMESRFLRNAVPIEAKKYIPIPMEVLSHDFQSVSLPIDQSGKAKIGILMAVTQKNNLSNIAALLNHLGLESAGLEVAPLSVLRLWQNLDVNQEMGPFIHVHMDGGNVRVMVADRNMPVFFREVFLGERSSISDMRKIDLLGCLSFVQKQLGVSGIKHIRVSGTCENMDALTQEFSKETGMPAKYVDFPSLLAIKSGDWGGYAALGAAVLPSNKQYNLDISVIDRVSHEELRTARTIMTMGAILASFLCLGGLSNMLSYKYRARELFVNDMKLTPEIKTIFAGKQSADIESMLQDMTTQLGILSGVARSKNQKLSVLFRQIIEAMPERVWLERINVTNPLLASNTLTGSIDLSGKAQDNTVSDEQALVFQFKENLLKHPILGKKYDITISVQGKASSGVMTGAAGGLDPKELAQKLEDRTSFNLRMTVKK